MCVPFRFVLRGLMRRQESQHAATEFRIQPQGLQGGDDAIPSEGRAEPGYTGIGIGPLGGFGREHEQIGGGLVDPVIELLVGSEYLCQGLSLGCGPGLAGLTRLPVTDDLTGAIILQAGNRELQFHAAAGCDPQPEARGLRIQIRGLTIEHQPGAPHLPVQTGITQCYVSRPDLGVQHVAAPWAMQTTHFENVGKIRFEMQLQVEIQGAATVIVQTHDLVQRTIPENLAPQQVQAVTGHAPAMLFQLGEGEIDQQFPVVLAHRGIEQQGPQVVHGQPETGQMAGAIMVQTLFAQTKMLDIAKAVVDDEGIVQFEDARAIIGPGGAGAHVLLLIEFNDVVHASGPRFAPSRCPNPSDTEDMAPGHGTGEMVRNSDGRLFGTAVQPAMR